MNKSPRQFLANLAKQTYEHYADRSDPWSLGDVIEEAKKRAATFQLDRQLLEYAVEQAVDQYDNERRHQLDSHQLNLSSLDDDSLDGVLALGDGGRVKLRYAHLSDLDAWYSLQLTAYNRLTQAHANKTQFYSDLRPRLLAGGAVEDVVV